MNQSHPDAKIIKTLRRQLLTGEEDSNGQNRQNGVVWISPSFDQVKWENDSGLDYFHFKKVRKSNIFFEPEVNFTIYSFRKLSES